MADDDIPGSGSSGTFSAASLSADLQEVKGLMFETLRNELPKRFGGKKWDQLLYMLPRQTCEVLEHPEITEWYAESEMRRIAHLVFDMFCDRDEDKFVELSRELASAGIRRFFRMIPDLASGRFVLKNMPTFFNRVRRGTATLSVEADPDGRILLTYDNYRYARDRLYRLMAMATCQAAVEVATGKIPEAKIEKWNRSSMVLAFTLGD